MSDDCHLGPAATSCSSALFPHHSPQAGTLLGLALEPWIPGSFLSFVIMLLSGIWTTLPTL